MKKLFLILSVLLPAVLFGNDAGAAQKNVPDNEGSVKMVYKQFGNKYVIRLNKNEEIINTLQEFCAEREIAFGTITGIGSLKSVTLGFFDPSTKEYKEKTFREPLEMANMTGNITIKDGKPLLHIHTTVAGKNYKALAGHMVKAEISLTGEIIIDAVNAKVEKAFDKDTGLNLIKFK